MPELNIITSSDNRLVKHIFTQLKNISENLSAKYTVHFWLFHYRIEKSDIKALEKYSTYLGIKFHEIFVSDYKDYEYLTKGADVRFPIETYLYFCAHKYLPRNIDRVLYIDAGDIIIDGDIEEFYFAPFEGNFVIATIAFSSQKELYSFDDIDVTKKAVNIVTEYVNSGSLMLNLSLMRIWNIDLAFYRNIVDYLIKKVPPFTTGFYSAPIHYSYDQGLLAAAFVGRIRFWGYEKYGYNNLFMPYNFRAFILEANKKSLGIPDGANIDFGYEPHIIHLLGNKPWSTDKAKYDSLLPISRKYLDMFWEVEQRAKEDLIKLGFKYAE
jgi:lipopolysaccharide biosynthesis glycosyltransferase